MELCMVSLIGMLMQLQVLSLSKNQLMGTLPDLSNLTNVSPTSVFKPI